MNKDETPGLSRYLGPRHWPTWLGLGLLYLMQRLPYPLMMGLGRGIGRLLYHLLPGRRHIVDVNLRLCFPDWDAAKHRRIAHAHFQNVGCALLESALSWWGSDARLRPLAHIRGLEHLEGASAEGKGVILLSAHFTCFELGARLLTMHHPFQFLYKLQRKNPLFETYTTGLRLRHYLRAVPHRDLRALARGLKQRLTSWYLPDQDFGRKNSVFADFMGVPTSTVTATARLVSMTGARVVPYFPLRRADGSGYDIHILPALEDFPSGDDVADARRINALIEPYIEQDPAQYLWLHKRFKTRPEGEADVYAR